VAGLPPPVANRLWGLAKQRNNHHAEATNKRIANQDDAMLHFDGLCGEYPWALACGSDIDWSVGKADDGTDYLWDGARVDVKYRTYTGANLELGIPVTFGREKTAHTDILALARPHARDKYQRWRWIDLMGWIDVDRFWLEAKKKRWAAWNWVVPVDALHSVRTGSGRVPLRRGGV